MTRPIQLDKTYGVLHTENYFSFLGFAKKVGSDETQKIDVFLDNKLIDTIEANEFIQKIDDMYDVKSKAFTYNLPTQYIGKKAIISFKNHDSQEELLNSPYTLIDKNHESFNEAMFLHSLEGNFDNEKIQNINTKDSIGFLATEDNLLNQDLIKLINTFLEQNLDTRFKLFYFNNEQKKLISEQFNKYLSKIDFIMPKDIYDIANNTSIYIHSSTANEKSKSFEYHKLWQVLNETKANMFMINIFEEIDDKDYSKSLKLVDNCKIEFEKSVVSKIFENDERYNEFRFINSINQPISEEIKNIYCPNSIGFLATKENLEDDEFMGYIKELMERFPDVEFKGFCFNENEKNLLEKLNIEIFLISNITQITEKTNLFIQTLKHINLVPFLITQDIYYIWFINEAYNSNLTVYDYDSNKDSYNFKQFNYKNTEIISDNYAINFRNKMNSNSNNELLSEIIYFEKLKCYFESQKFKNFLLKK
ncbi:hypothetical protein Q6A87_05205 [Aliarcobacter skirrowii]|uniref:hypothetical protein n=1 Tax=Aliarcobacter skirrowii TaxID=28200 RepID=UPI0029BB181B|nr:hypothetical protein [Aliarcobacter skirrowii]MDX4067241.1 hypothetical protein [Aliarcobacter skirrowii]